MTLVCTTVSQYPLFLEDDPPDSTMLYVREVCDTMSNVDSVMHEVGCTEICWVSPTKNQSVKNSEEKILRTYYLCSKSSSCQADFDTPQSTDLFIASSFHICYIHYPSRIQRNKLNTAEWSLPSTIT